MSVTLASLLAEHPEWKDLPLTVMGSTGELDYIGASGMVFQGEGEEKEPVVVFAPN